MAEPKTHSFFISYDEGRTATSAAEPPRPNQRGAVAEPKTSLLAAPACSQRAPPHHGYRHPDHPGHHWRRCRRHGRRPGGQHAAAAVALTSAPATCARRLATLLSSLWRARVLLAGLLMPLPEPTTEAELKQLKLKGRSGTAYPYRRPLTRARSTLLCADSTFATWIV